MTNQFIQILSTVAIPLLFAITVHEAAHGFVASKLGDKTALILGRVTLNPIKHIDLIGTIFLPLMMLYLGGFVFGWAKPVPINWQNLQHPKRDSALVAIAGPVSNLMMALIWALICKIIIFFVNSNLSNSLEIISITTVLYNASKFGIMINCALIILNMIPIPPLDGSRIVSSLLPTKANIYYNSIEPYGIWILLGLFVAGLLQRVLLPMIELLNLLILNLFGVPL